jgi:hypothetical protein
MQETWSEGSFSDTTAAHQDFAKFFAAASNPPREGYWSPFATLAWIVSRDDRFVAATQMFEEAHHSNRGALFSEISWVVLGNEANQRFGRNLSECCDDELRPALEENRLEGGIASQLTGGAPEVVARHQWVAWQRSANISGLVLIPGYVDFKWPSEAVRRAFPISTEETALPFLPSGSQGRPTSKSIWLGIFEQRLANGECDPHSLAAEAQAVATAFNNDRGYLRWPRVKDTTVRNAIRVRYNKEVRAQN